MSRRRIVDALGTRCPVPIALAERAAGRLAKGDVIELLADDPMVVVDLPAWCHERGHSLIGIEEAQGGHVATVLLGDVGG